MRKTFILVALLTVLFGSHAHAQMNGQVGCTDNPSCCPFTETHHNTCGNGSDGEVVIQRTVNGCGGDTPWVTISSTCPCVPAYDPPETIACAAPQSGTILRHRLANAGGSCGMYGGWETISSTCANTPTPPGDPCEALGTCPVANPIPLDLFVTQDTQGNSMYFVDDRTGSNRNANNVLLNQDNALRMCAGVGYSKVVNFGGAWMGKWKGHGSCGDSDIDLYRFTFFGDRNDAASVTNLGNYSRAFIKGKDTNCDSWMQSALCAKEAIPEARLTQTTSLVDDPNSVTMPAGYPQCPADLDLRYGLTSTKYFATAPARTIGTQAGITAAAILKGPTATAFNPYIETACRYRFTCAQKSSGPEEQSCVSWEYDEWRGETYCSAYSEPSGKTQVIVSTLNCN